MQTPKIVFQVGKLALVNPEMAYSIDHWLVDG